MNVLLCTVNRNKDKLPVSVFAHEIAVLEVMYGRGSVQIVDEDYDELEIDTDADVEFSRLLGKYKPREGRDPVRAAFPGGAYDLERHGFKTGAIAKTVTGDQRVASLEKDRRKDKKKPAKKAAAA